MLWNSQQLGIIYKKFVAQIKMLWIYEFTKINRRKILTFTNN